MLNHGGLTRRPWCFYTIREVEEARASSSVRLNVRRMVRAFMNYLRVIAPFFTWCGGGYNHLFFIQLMFIFFFFIYPFIYKVMDIHVTGPNSY